MLAFVERVPLYLQLMRFDRPVGTLLLLWPTLAALWMAAAGTPPLHLILIFSLGTVIMRAAGCVINDYADRDVDPHVARTQSRPLATGALHETEALVLFGILMTIGALLILFLNPLTRWMAVAGAAIAITYPFMKRFTYLPQVVLGAAFSWGIVMAFTAIEEQLSEAGWLMFLASLLWIVAYDTEYAMVDRDDDLKAGIKSTAILFGQADRLMIGVLQASTVAALVLLGQRFSFGLVYFFAIVVVAVLFGYQQYLIRKRDRGGSFAAFKNNVWVGFAVFIGVVIELDLAPRFLDLLA
jgi:4-hydroxybenzoate polyprenyltransferase